MAEALAAPSRARPTMRAVASTAARGAAPGAVPDVAAEDAVTSYFEVHVRRSDRWVIDCTAPSAAEAVAEAEDIARRAEVLAVKVINERYNRHTDQSAARIVFTLEKPERRRPQGVVRATAAPRRAAAPQAAPVVEWAAEPEPATGAQPGEAAVPIPPHLPHLSAPQPAPWLLFAWASLGLALAATLLFVFLLFAG